MHAQANDTNMNTIHQYKAKTKQDGQIMSDIVLSGGLMKSGPVVTNLVAA